MKKNLTIFLFAVFSLPSWCSTMSWSEVNQSILEFYPCAHPSYFALKGTSSPTTEEKTELLRDIEWTLNFFKIAKVENEELRDAWLFVLREQKNHLNGIKINFTLWQDRFKYILQNTLPSDFYSLALGGRNEIFELDRQAYPFVHPLDVWNLQNASGVLSEEDRNTLLKNSQKILNLLKTIEFSRNPFVNAWICFLDTQNWLASGEWDWERWEDAYHDLKSALYRELDRQHKESRKSLMVLEEIERKELKAPNIDKESIAKEIWQRALEDEKKKHIKEEAQKRKAILEMQSTSLNRIIALEVKCLGSIRNRERLAREENEFKELQRRISLLRNIKESLTNTAADETNKRTAIQADCQRNWETVLLEHRTTRRKITEDHFCQLENASRNALEDDFRTSWGELHKIFLESWKNAHAAEEKEQKRLAFEASQQAKAEAEKTAKEKRNLALEEAKREKQLKQSAKQQNQMEEQKKWDQRKKEINDLIQEMTRIKDGDDLPIEIEADIDNALNALRKDLKAFNQKDISPADRQKLLQNAYSKEQKAKFASYRKLIKDANNGLQEEEEKQRALVETNAKNATIVADMKPFVDPICAALKEIMDFIQADQKKLQTQLGWTSFPDNIKSDMALNKLIFNKVKKMLDTTLGLRDPSKFNQFPVLLRDLQLQESRRNIHQFFQHSTEALRIAAEQNEATIQHCQQRIKTFPTASARNPATPPSDMRIFLESAQNQAAIALEVIKNDQNACQKSLNDVRELMKKTEDLIRDFNYAMDLVDSELAKRIHPHQKSCKNR